MRIACWITKATDTSLEYVILIAMRLQQLLRERVTILRSTYIVRLENKMFIMLLLPCLQYKYAFGLQISVAV
jgi:hypothetical protein